MEGLERGLIIVSYLAALAVVVVGFVTGFPVGEPTVLEWAVALTAGVPAGFLLVFSLFGLVSYFVFIPSISNDGHLFSAVHGIQLLHPLTTALVLGLLVVCVFNGNPVVWGFWAVLLGAYLVQTALIVRRTRQEHLANGLGNNGPSAFLLLFNLILGGELVTIAAGAKPLAPWKLDTLPEDTWVVDVRTKPEYYWNRLNAAENYPWGVGLVEAAKEIPKDRPVVVTCLSGHRSPAVAVTLRRLGFKTVYNLNWGILYLMLLKRGTKDEGPFSLTRPHRDPHRRGEDLIAVTQGYVALALVTLVGAPLENLFFGRTPSVAQIAVGATLGLVGFAIGMLSFRALGRNFRVYMAPRRSGTLVTTGIYSRVRHPMYTGVIVGLLGYIILFGSLFCVASWLGVTILYAVKSVKEERALAEKFPEYEEYRSGTWRFIPYIY